MTSRRYDRNKIEECREAIMEDAIIVNIINRKQEVLLRAKTHATVNLTGELIAFDLDANTKLELMHLDLETTNRIQIIKKHYGL